MTNRFILLCSFIFIFFDKNYEFQIKNKKFSFLKKGFLFFEKDTPMISWWDSSLTDKEKSIKYKLHYSKSYEGSKKIYFKNKSKGRKKKNNSQLLVFLFLGRIKKKIIFCIFYFIPNFYNIFNIICFNNKTAFNSPKLF